jgi:hypothetical protein
MKSWRTARRSGSPGRRYSSAATGSSSVDEITQAHEGCDFRFLHADSGTGYLLGISRRTW